MEFEERVLAYLKGILDALEKIGALLLVITLIAVYFLIHTIWGKI
jgi:hypothetical protein